MKLKTNITVVAVASLFGLVTPIFGQQHYAETPESKSTRTSAKPFAPSSQLPLVVWIRREDMKLVIEMNNQVYKDKTAVRFDIGEEALNGKDRLVVILAEDSIMMTDLKDISVMALNAGYRKISVFMIWKKTGGMAEMLLARQDENFAEILFGPVHHATNKPKRLQKMITHVSELGPSRAE